MLQMVKCHSHCLVLFGRVTTADSTTVISKNGGFTTHPTRFDPKCEQS